MGFDVPKLYFHRLAYSNGRSSSYGGKEHRYSVIDGKQRLIALWDFMSGNIALPQDFEFFNDKSIEARYSQIRRPVIGFSNIAGSFRRLQPSRYPSGRR